MKARKGLTKKVKPPTRDERRWKAEEWIKKVGQRRDFNEWDVFEVLEIMLTPFQFKVLNLLYQQLPHAEIARQVGVGRRRVSDGRWALGRDVKQAMRMLRFQETIADN